MRLLSPGDGTEGADELCVLWSGLLQKRIPVPLLHHAGKSGMNTLRGAKPQEARTGHR